MRNAIARYGSSRRDRLLLCGRLAAALALLATVSCASVPDSSTPPSDPPAAGEPGPHRNPGGSAASSETESGGASVAPGVIPVLPEPTGPQPVGTTSLHLRDLSRPDPWLPTENARELMVSLWYPATSPATGRAQYMTPEESELLLSSAGITEGALDALSRTRIDATVDAEPAGPEHGLPLVVLSPGFTKPRATLTGLAEDLASNGYVVATIDHTNENVATTFPDGRVAGCVACDGAKDQAFWEKLSAGRATDISFVLDQLTQPHATWPGASLIDPSRIAVVGHSAGGASAIDAMAGDARVRAGIDMDGTTYGTIPAGGLSRPFLFLGRQEMYSPGSGAEAATWESDWTRLTGWKRWLVVAGAVHESFNDIVVLADQLGVDADAELPGARSMEITRRYVRAFLDLHLLAKPQPLLETRSADYPEVGLCSPGTKTCG